MMLQTHSTYGKSDTKTLAVTKHAFIHPEKLTHLSRVHPRHPRFLTKTYHKSIRVGGASHFVGRVPQCDWCPDHFQVVHPGACPPWPEMNRDDAKGGKCQGSDVEKSYAKSKS